MESRTRSSVSRHAVLLTGVLIALLALLPVIAQSQTIAQSPRLAANVAGGGLEIVADITGTEVLSIDVAGPGIGVVHTESKESPVFLPTSELTDASYRFEVQLVDAETGKIVDRLAGVFTVKDGHALVPVQKKDRRAGGLLPAFAQVMKNFAKSVCSFFVSEAEAADLTVSDAGSADLFIHVTNVGATAQWDIDAVGCNLGAFGTCFDIWSYGVAGYALRFADSPNVLRSFLVDGAGDIHFADDGMVFDRSLRRLGINNTTPSYIIDAVGQSQIKLRDNTLSTSRAIALRNDGIATDLEAQHSDLWIRADMPISSPAHNIYMLSNKVGVGTTEPDSKLHVIGQTPPQFIVQNDAGNARMDFRRSSATGVSQLLFGTGSLSGGTMDYQIGMFLNTIFQIRVTNDSTRGIALTPGGNVGIGKTAPAAKLDVAGIVRATGFDGTSDVRLKDNVRTISGALGKVMGVEGVSFTWKRDGDRSGEFPEGMHYGVVAQQVEEVMPEVVRTAPGGEKSVSYTEIVPVLIEAIKEQQKIIEQQQSAMERQQRTIAELSDKVEELMRLVLLKGAVAGVTRE